MNDLSITDRGKVFVDAVLSGLPLHVAGKKAGYVHPERDVYPVLSDLRTRSYFRKQIRGKAETEGLAVAYNYLIEVIRDTTKDTRVRLDAAKFVYAHHMPAHKALEAVADVDKSPTEMTNEELRRSIEEGERELSERAKPVPQGLDMLD